MASCSLSNDTREFLLQAAFVMFILSLRWYGPDLYEQRAFTPDGAELRFTRCQGDLFVNACYFVELPVDFPSGTTYCARFNPFCSKGTANDFFFMVLESLFYAALYPFAFLWDFMFLVERLPVLAERLRQ